MTLVHRARELAQRIATGVATGVGNGVGTGVGTGVGVGPALRRPPTPPTPPCWSGPQLVQLLHRYAVDLVLDVGGRSGGYGTQLRRGGYHGRIVSFEPLRAPRAALHRAAAPDERWSVLPFALGDTSDGQPTGPRRLDDLWEEVVAPGERVFLKLDTRGHEARALRGTGEYITECAGLQTGTSLGPGPGPGPGPGLTPALPFNHTLSYAQQTLGLTLMSVVPGPSHPESGQMLSCELVLFKDDEERQHEEEDGVAHPYTVP